MSHYFKDPKDYVLDGSSQIIQQEEPNCEGKEKWLLALGN